MKKMSREDMTFDSYMRISKLVEELEKEYGTELIMPIVGQIHCYLMKKQIREVENTSTRGEYNDKQTSV